MGSWRGRERSSRGRRAVWPLLPVISEGPVAAAGVEAGDSERDTDRQGQIRSASLHLGVVVVAKYLVLFSLTGETMKRFVAKPSDRAAVVRELAESARGQS